ncbi:MAG: DUF4136 domain-containing protein [Pseudomonadota bacterium]|nr:DUF4136 domain-containing protein [Pseudomonadota bacterium]
MRWLAVLAGAATLAGCASFHSLSNDVSSYSRWPTGRPPRSYAFERLPSQQTHLPQTQQLEDAARPALEAAGFVAAGEAATADVVVQLGARIAAQRSPFDDPFWYGPYGIWHRPFGPRRFGPAGWGYGWGYGPGWGLYGYGGAGYGFTDYEREVGVLIRDKRSGEALYEARAVSEGSSADGNILPAMFSAALRDFPGGSSTNPHRIVVDTRPFEAARR